MNRVEGEGVFLFLCLWLWIAVCVQLFDFKTKKQKNDWMIWLCLWLFVDWLIDDGLCCVLMELNEWIGLQKCVFDCFCFIFFILNIDWFDWCFWWKMECFLLMFFDFNFLNSFFVFVFEQIQNEMKNEKRKK